MFSVKRRSIEKYQRLLPGPSNSGETEIIVEFLSYPA